MPTSQNRPEPMQVLTTDVRASLLEAVLGPFRRMLQNEVVFVLLLILVAGMVAVYWVAVKLEAFATEQIPKHIEAINAGSKAVTTEFTRKLTERDQTFSTDLQAQREHYLQLRKLDETNIDRIERLTIGGKKSVSAAPTPPPPFQNE